MKYLLIVVVAYLCCENCHSTSNKRPRRQIVFPGRFQDHEGNVYQNIDDFNARQKPSDKQNHPDSNILDPITNILPQDCGTRRLDFDAGAAEEVFKRSAEDDGFKEGNTTDKLLIFQVAGGFEADEGKWPWAVILGQPQGEGFRVICGGTLITNQHVLTAAHCFPDKPSADTKITHVRLGEQDVSLNFDTITPVDVQICDVRKHEDYFLGKEVRNDMAVLKLCKTVDFGTRIQPACLPSLGSDPSGNLTVVGWGSERAGGRAVTALRQADVVRVNLTECQQRYSAIGKHIERMHICAGKGVTDACAGDSGGPLLATSNSRWTVYGVTSFGVGCANGNFPGVYTNVAEFVGWIKEKLY